MATSRGPVAELVIDASVNSVGVTQGLNDGARAFDRFASNAEAAAARVARAMNVSTETAMAALEKQNGDVARTIVALNQEANAAEKTAAAVSQGAAKQDAALERLQRRMGLLELEAYKMDAAMRKAAWQEYIGTAEKATVATQRFSNLGIARINMELGTFTGRVTGLNTAMTRLFAMVGGNLVGMTEMIAVMASIAGVLWVWQHLTENARKAREEIEEGTKSLREWYRVQAAGAGGKFALDVEAGEAMLKQQQATLESARQRLENAKNAPGAEDVRVSGRPGVVSSQTAARELADAKRAFDEQALIVTEAQEHLRKLRLESYQKEDADRTRDIAAVIKGDKADLAARRYGLEQLKILNDQIAKERGNINLAAERAALISRRDELQDALFPKAKREPIDKEARDRAKDLERERNALPVPGWIGEAGADAPIKRTEATIRVVDALRESLGEFAAETITAERDLKTLNDAFETLQRLGIGDQQSLNIARGKLAKEKEAIAKGQAAEIFNPDMARDWYVDFEANLKAFREGLKSTNTEWQNMRVGIEGVLDIARGFGEVGANIQRFGSTALHALDSAKAISKVRNDPKSGGLLGSIEGVSALVGGAGAVIGAVSAVASMFRHHDEALDRNTQRLEQLRNAMIDTRGLAGQQTALSAIEQWIKGGGGGGMSSGFGNQGLDAIVQRSGLTLAQFNKIASDLGIEFSKGTDWIIQFQQALQLSIDATRKFGAGLSDVQSLEALRLKVYGKDAPQDAIASTLKVLQQFAPRLAEGLANIDVNTPEGQAALRTGLQTLFERLAGGSLTTEDFGTLSGAKELAGIIDALTGSLSSLEKSASKTAESLSNVPAGYKVALARFEAQDAVTVASVIAQLGGVSAGSAGRTDPTGSLPTDYPLIGSGSGSGVVVNGDVYVDARDKPADELFDAVLSAAQRKSQLDFGRSDMWSRVQAAY